jgi:hypothetical protein
VNKRKKRLVYIGKGPDHIGPWDVARMLHFVLIAIQFKKLLFTQWKIGSLQNKPKDKFGGFCNI